MTQDVQNNIMNNLCALKSIPSDMIHILSDYSDFRLSLSRPLRKSWEVNVRSKTFYESAVAVGDDLFVIGTGENEVEVYFQGKLYSAFKIPKYCGLSIHKSTSELARQTIIVLCRHPRLKSEYFTKTSPDTFDVLFFNIHGELLNKTTIQSGFNIFDGFSLIDVDSNGNIILKYFRFFLNFILTYSQQGTQLQTMQFNMEKYHIDNDSYIFSFDHDIIEKRDVRNFKKIISKIEIPGFDNCDRRVCCVPNFPEQILIRIISPHGYNYKLILVDFDNPGLLKVICENVPSFLKFSVGMTGKITLFGQNDAQCYE